jgi:restriction system protein
MRVAARAQLAATMKYETTGINHYDAGHTTLHLKDKTWVEFALIPWSKNGRARLNLNPANVAQLSGTITDCIEVSPTEAMPVFTATELQIVLATVKTQTAQIQAQNKKPFKYIAAEVKSVSSVADLLLKSVIVPGEKTKQGILIEAVALPWFEIIEILKKNPKLAFEIPPRKWEEIIAGVYKRAGFEEVTLTPRSGDLGRDVIAVKRGVGIIRVIDQVKAYKPGHLVVADDVRALFGVVNADNASKGFLTTTSDFAPKLREDALLKPFIPARLELINGTALLKRLEEFSRQNPR